MKHPKLEAMPIDQLIRLFVAIGLAQDEALLGGDVSKFNRLFDEMWAVTEELRNRPGDQRGALLHLYDHVNAQVRLKAIISTLAVAPQSARTALQALANSRDHPQAGDAGMTLINLDRGIFKPT